MSTVMWLAFVIFVITYVLISIRRFRWFNIERPAVAMLGAALMILLGVVTPTQALQAIDLNTIALLLGMMLLVASLELCGFFNWVSLKIIDHSQNQFQFLVLVMVSTAALSALILNDTVVLLFTPIIIKTCRLIKANPIPFMVAEAISANIGSVGTEVGNPQNAFIATQSGITFVDFSAKLLPITVVCMVVAIIMIWIVFRKDLMAEGENDEGAKEVGRKRSFLTQRSRAIDHEEAKRSLGERSLSRAVYLVIGAICLVFLGFLAAPQLGLPLSLIAFSGGAVALFVLPLFDRGLSAKTILKGVDWSLLLFFVGLFVVLKGVDVSGLMNEMVIAFQGTGAGLTSISGLTAFSALLSNLISNVPAVMLLSPLVSIQASDPLWLALATSSTLAGNATILGAAANVIVAESGEKQGVNLPFWKFVKAGLPITIVTLLISVLMLQLLG